MLAALAAAAMSGGPVITLAAVGDVILVRGIERSIRQEGPKYPFALVRGMLGRADIALANLECPITDRPVQTSGRIGFRASRDLAGALSSSGLDVVSVANNHILDCGPEGRADTIRALSHLGIKAVGSGDDPVVVAVKGLKIAFVGFSEYWSEGIAGPTPVVATRRLVTQTVASARRRADIVVASFHWGSEGAPLPTESQSLLARAAHEAGADLVLGHHPHVLQPLQFLSRGRKTLVAYSMGNFLFDAPSGEQRTSAVLACRLSMRGLLSAKLVPVRIEGYRPRLATQAEARALWRSLGPRCNDLGTDLSYHAGSLVARPLARRSSLKRPSLVDGTSCRACSLWPALR